MAERLIDAEALRDALYEADAITMRGVAIINQFPTIEAKPVVHGRNLSADTPSQFECSVCGCEDWDTYTCDVDVYKYCPKCGAQMDEGVKIPVISMEDVPKIAKEMENNG